LSRDLDLNLMRVLVTLDECRSVSGTASRLERSQPATSAALAKLRQYFDDPLFIRVGGTMQPTPQAVSVVAAARDALRIVNLKMTMGRAFNPASSDRPVTLALSDVGEVIFLPAILHMVRERMPKAAVRSVSMPAADVTHAMERGDIDLAIGYFPDLVGRMFLQQVLFRDSFACLIRADHPFKKERLSIQEFTRLDHAVVRAESRSEEVFERYLARRKLKRRIVLTTPHFASAPLVVAQSDLVVTVPEPLAHCFAGGSSNVRVVGLPFVPPSIALKQLWHRKYHNDPRNRWLRARIFEQFSVRRGNTVTGPQRR
jgi:DNA-binding transcriptional LysR family regulator